MFDWSLKPLAQPTHSLNMSKGNPFLSMRSLVLHLHRRTAELCMPVNMCSGPQYLVQ